MNVDRDARRELLRLALPVADERHRADDEGRPQALFRWDVRLLRDE
jgi:hypothetical protein